MDSENLQEHKKQYKIDQAEQEAYQRRRNPDYHRKKKRKTPVDIIIIIEGGLIQNVISSEPLAITIRDYDTDGADPAIEDIYQDEEGHFFIEYNFEQE